MRALRADRFLTFRARMTVETRDREATTEERIIYFQSWESVAAVVGFRLAVERTEAIFNHPVHIKSVDVIRLSVAGSQTKEINKKILSWSEQGIPAHDHLKELAARERRSLDGFKLIDVA